MSNRKLTLINYIFLFIIIYFIAGFILYPLISLLNESFSTAGMFSFAAYTELLSSNSTGATLNSIALSLITVIGSAIVGIFFSYIFYFHKIPSKNFFSSLLLIPIATPPLVGVVAFLFLLNENGLISKAVMELLNMNQPLFKFDGWTAIITVHIYSFYPFFFLFIYTALQKMDLNIIDASYTLGASRTKTFIKVIFPLLIPSIVASSLIVFMASMASFSAPFIFGGTSRFLTTEIFTAKINGDTSFASSLSILLTLISLCFLFLSRWYRSRNVTLYSSKGTPRKLVFQKSDRYKLSGTMFTVAFSLVIILPVITLLYLSFIPEGSLMRNVFKESLTFGNYNKIFSDRNFAEPFFNSIEMSAAAVIITLIIGVSAAFMTVKKNLKGRGFIEGILSLPYGIPGTVIALGLIVSFNTPVVFTAMTPLVGTFWIIVIAYAVRNLPLIMQSSLAGFYSLDPSLGEASSALGASESRTFRSITIPLLVPSILNGALLVFINSLGEFVSTILLYSYDTRTIAIEIYSQLRLYNSGTAAAYGIILFVLVMVVVYFSKRSVLSEKQ